MKKIIAILTLLALTLSLFACASPEGESTRDPDNFRKDDEAFDTDSLPSLLATENHRVDLDMMTYYFFSDFYNFYNQYGAYLSYMGASLDPTASLSAQISTDGENSWYKYFLDGTLNNVSNFLYYAEAATDAGFEAEDLDEKVDEQIDYLRSYAESQSMDFETYITSIFGETITEDVVRDSLKLQLYANEYYEKTVQDYRDSLTDEDYESYYTENQKSFDKVDYLSYTAEEETDPDALPTEDEIRERAETTAEGAAYLEGDEFSEWAFADDRKAGDITLIDGTVYMIEKTAYRDEAEASRDVRHILVMTGGELSDGEAAAKAEDILAQYLAGDRTAEAFDALAQEYNEDSNSLYEDVTKGQMVEEFESWLFDEAKAVGDTGIVKTRYGYHVMYLEATGEEQWKSDIYDILFEEYLNETVAKWKEEYTLTKDTEMISEVPDTLPQTAFTQSEDTADTTGAAEVITDSAADTDDGEASDTGETATY